jgi:hypothetical protein
MALLNFDNNPQPQSGGLLGDLDPTSRAMLAMALFSKMSNKRGAQSGFGDMFNFMLQAQQMKRQQAADELARQKFGLEQQEFGYKTKLYESQLAEAQRKAAQEAATREKLGSIAQSVIDYKAPTKEMAPVIPEYENLQAGDQAFQIPTESYINNLGQAATDAANTQTKGAFVADPAVRQQAAAMIQTGDPQLIKQAFDLLQQGGAFTLSEGQTRYTGMGDAIVTAPNIREQQDKTFDREYKLRGEVSNINKSFREVSDSYGRILKSAENPSPAGDLALIFNYMKMLDPGSTVREGEFANAENSANVPTWVRQRYNKAVSGERLTDNMRADFLSRSRGLYESQRESYLQTQDQYRDLAKRNNLNPENVLINYEVPGRYEAKPSASQANGGMVTVQTPDGRVGSIPAQNLEQALKLGAKRVS